LEKDEEAKEEKADLP